LKCGKEYQGKRSQTLHHFFAATNTERILIGILTAWKMAQVWFEEAIDL
jgi:hypothetical protein